ncbi:MAG: glucose-1-phosphate thymidylyltransferase [Bacteroidetes bacterium]|nr:glucose-1-phosphate thymidylyltransferase [Bacteroidota bacterium]
MKISLFDDQQRDHLLPLTFTRPCAELRVGILTIREKWEKRTGNDCRFETQDYLSAKFPGWGESTELWINGRVLPDASLAETVLSLKEGEGLKTISGKIIATKGFSPSSDNSGFLWKESEADFVDFPEDIFLKNEQEIRRDFNLITAGRTSEKLSSSNVVTGKGEIFLEAGARVEGAFLNPDGGVIYVGKDAEIMEGAMVRGSLAICEHGALKLGAKIYGATTVGPYSKVGGEVGNSVITGFSNKGHDGFLGNSVLGEWCNLGADTNNSNLKNNYAEVKLWDYPTKRFRATGQQFCGLIMGDHSKCGINTMFNTGTMVGVSSNIFGSGFPRNFVPSFSWGGSSGFTTYQLNKAFETAALVMMRRGKELDQTEKEILKHVFEQTSGNRFWEGSTSIV